MRPLTTRELARNTTDIALRFLSFRSRPFWPRSRVRRYQLAALRRLVAHAYSHVGLYRDAYRRAGVHPNDLQSLADFERFPTITKDDVLDAYPSRALERGIRMERCLVSKSSGSTGQMLDVVHRAGAIGLQGLAMHRLLSLHHPYWPWHRFAYVYTSAYPVMSLFGTYPMLFLPTLAGTARIVEQLERFRPHVLACYPSHARDLVAEVGEVQLRGWRLKALSLSSEPSSQHERDRLAAAFGCPVYDEYSTEELTRVAAQARCGRYHLFEDVAYIEVLRDGTQAPALEGEVGEVVGTNLENYAMPFIRYRQGDRAAIESSPCPCGRSFRKLSKLAGRRLDDFPLPSGRVLRSGWLLDASYDLVLDLGADIATFRIEQETISRIRIDVVPGKGYEVAMDRAIAERLVSLIGEPIEVVVTRVPAIPRTAGGKRHPIVSRVIDGRQA